MTNVKAPWTTTWRLVVLAAAAALVPAAQTLAQPYVPADSVVGTMGAGESLVLVSPLEAGSPIQAGGTQMKRLSSRKADAALGVKLGRDAISLSGLADAEGKGDFTVAARIPGETKAIGCWVYLPKDANVASVGFQIYDNEGEALLFQTPADWTGWKWIETPVTDAAFTQAYPQEDRNKTVDMPINAVHIAWRSRQPGLSEVVVDGLFARTVRPEGQAASAVTAEILGAADVARDAQYSGLLLLTNSTNKDADVQAEISLQQDGSFFSAPLPDPILGTDHARGARGWTVVDGKTIAENTLTDGLDYTGAETAAGVADADEFVELDKARPVTAMGWLSGDAKWIWTADVFASLDGKTFTPVPELQGVVMQKKWGRQRFPKFKPFDAKVIKLHYHNDGDKLPALRLPNALMVWDGIADEKLDIPTVGKELQRIKITKNVPAGAFALVDLNFQPKLPTGQYLLASKLTVGDYTKLDTRAIFVEPAWLDGVDASSKFGLNGGGAGLAKEERRLGIGWLRFENFKWSMVSPTPHDYAFDGSVAPWKVNIDQITQEYRDAGLNILPMMFLAPAWATAADENTPKSIRLALPPKDYANFGEFAFQSVARYGSTKVDASRLKTQDKQTGLGRIKYFELGNEPDLNPLRDPKNPPTYGPWAATMKEFWDMWRYGAEAVKQADPGAIVSSPGFAGQTSEKLDQMRIHKYADGKCPLDFVELLSVHFYSGRTPPEIATKDANNSQNLEVTVLEHLKRLAEWRDQYKPGTPIWMTETGYDTGGPIGTNEWTQAARLPRDVAMCLANGVEKVIVYRESGSTPVQHGAAGVWRNDLSRKPSWYTYATLIRQLDKATPGYHLPSDKENVWLQTWNLGDKTMLMAYCVTGTGKLGIEFGKATVTDAFGGIRQVDSTHDLALGEYPVYISNMASDAPLTPLVQAAQKQEQLRKQTRAADAKKNIYLFSFGNANEAMATNIGRLRYYQSVPAETLYDAKNGYGFFGKPATRNEFWHYMKTPIDKYGVTLGKDQVFQFDVAPGQYELRISVKPGKKPATLILEGADGGTVNLECAPNGRDEVLTRDLRVSGKTLRLRGTSQHLLRWLALEETTRK